MANARRDPDESLRVRVRQRTQQYRVHEAEDRGVQADADGQRDHGDTGDERRPHQLAEPERRVEANLVKTKQHN
jgi:hypothetical protein